MGLGDVLDRTAAATGGRGEQLADVAVRLQGRRVQAAVGHLSVGRIEVRVGRWAGHMGLYTALLDHLDRIRPLWRLGEELGQIMVSASTTYTSKVHTWFNISPEARSWWCSQIHNVVWMSTRPTTYRRAVI